MQSMGLMSSELDGLKHGANSLVVEGEEPEYPEQKVMHKITCVSGGVARVWLVGGARGEIEMGERRWGEREGGWGGGGGGGGGERERGELTNLLSKWVDVFDLEMHPLVVWVGGWEGICVGSGVSLAVGC